MTKILKSPKVQELTTFSRSTIYRLMSEGKFPKQIKLSKHSVGWLESEISEYIESRINNRNNGGDYEA